ncbi:TIGR01459 family HAD-type hydrolase [Palleronia sp.]|uniref:TIGR01459 family HAD-type hydrolase n=1 Tax=Palleronia sp. TaxID=1940284 RepID=UPI0035C7C633
MTQLIQALSDISDDYDALFCDLWGCLHDGVVAFPDAVAALEAYRDRGGMVVLLTNAPRPRAEVAEQIAKFGIPESAWDTIATSGDAARVALFTGAVGSTVFHIGEPRDEGFFEPLAIIDNPVKISRTTDLSQATGVVCTGPFDPSADPTTLRPILLEAKTRRLPMLNANPDIVVDRGDRREFCGGAVAQLYEQMGGTVHAFGKPHPPVYDMARRRLAEAGGSDISDSRILAVGDGILTDVKGAIGEGLDSLFITGGLAAADIHLKGVLDRTRLDAFITNEGLSPTYALGMLR